MYRSDIINYLIKNNNYKTYLEIGYYKGWSFDNVNCAFKVAVDPNPSKNEDQQSIIYGSHVGNEKGWISKMTSDDFFGTFPPGEINQLTGKKFLEDFDIIFIDGLHEASQVSRDIENSLKHLNEGGSIVIHDCNPPTLAHATTGDAAGNWNGDVYKAFIKFRTENEDYDCYTVDTDWGCGIIQKMKAGAKRVLTLPNLHEKAINNWEDFDNYRDIVLNLISIEEFLKRNENGNSTNKGRELSTES